MTDPKFWVTRDFDWQQLFIMYGMVNNALMDLLIAHYREPLWLQIKAKAGVEDDIFVSTDSYPDEITYRLVSVASEIIDLPAEKVLHLFGRWWVLETATHNYGHLMKAGGRSLGEFLMNLPNLHTRVVMMFPDLQPPVFECTDVRLNELRLHYKSHRRGLSAFLIGMLEGLGEMFAVSVSINHERQVDEGDTHDVFHVAWSKVETL